MCNKIQLLRISCLTMWRFRQEENLKNEDLLLAASCYIFLSSSSDVGKMKRQRFWMIPSLKKQQSYSINKLEVQLREDDDIGLSASTDIKEPNDAPIIGILSQETYIVSSYFPNETYDSFIAASYVKYLESAGARVIPVWIGQDEAYYRRVVKYTNGILFPGGGTYFNETGGYGEAATQLYQIAIEYNNKGIYYPLWGTCLGMQVLIYAAMNGAKDIRVDCNLRNVAVPLDLVEDNYESSKLLGHAPDDIINILKRENTTYNLHRYCLTKEVLKDNALLDQWKILATNKDVNGLEFISAMEHNDYPFYGVQFHPEKSQFEFRKGKGFPHSFNSIKVAQYFANFFACECRENANKFEDATVEADSLIYNFSPVYTGLRYSGYHEQLYVFSKDDFDKVQLI